MNKLLPWLKVTMTPFMNIETLDLGEIPEKPGCYILISDHTEYIYPWGKSQVYYIGESKNLRNRIKTHMRHCKDLASGNRDVRYRYYWPRYEYAAAHGCNIGWIILDSEKSVKKIENTLIDDFSQKYGAKPVANG